MLPHVFVVWLNEFYCCRWHRRLLPQHQRNWAVPEAVPDVRPFRGAGRAETFDAHLFRGHSRSATLEVITAINHSFFVNFTPPEEVSLGPQFLSESAPPPWYHDSHVIGYGVAELRAVLINLVLGGGCVGRSSPPGGTWLREPPFNVTISSDFCGQKMKEQSLRWKSAKCGQRQKSHSVAAFCFFQVKLWSIDSTTLHLGCDFTKKWSRQLDLSVLCLKISTICGWIWLNLHEICIIL